MQFEGNKFSHTYYFQSVHFFYLKLVRSNKETTPKNMALPFFFSYVGCCIATGSKLNAVTSFALASTGQHSLLSQAIFFIINIGY